eukprot:13458964-Ditylum_brightwellii.AAC.1
MPSMIHLNRHLIFGVDGSTRQSVSFVDDNTLCYLASENTVVLRDIRDVVHRDRENEDDTEEDENNIYGKKQQRFICGAGMNELQEEREEIIDVNNDDHVFQGRGGDSQRRNQLPQQITSAFCVCRSRGLLAIAESDGAKKKKYEDDSTERRQNQEQKKENAGSCDDIDVSSSSSFVRSRITIFNLKTMRRMREINSDEVFNISSPSSLHKSSPADVNFDGSVGEVLDVSFGLDGTVIAVLFQKMTKDNANKNGHGRGKRPSSSSSLVLVCWDINEQSTPVTVDISMPVTGPKNSDNKLNGEATQRNLFRRRQQQKGQHIAFHPFDSRISIA